jgi:glycosyltransferase involved in cell wall biosynthesis
MIKVCFLCPHTKISGGVKVIFTLASFISADPDFHVVVSPKKYNDRLMTWFDRKVNFEIREMQQFDGFDIIVDYLDGSPRMGKSSITKHVLFLQGFGTQDREKEKENLKYSYDGVIATSSWLYNLAKSFGHKKLFLAPPGVDEKFTRVALRQPKIPIIGSLYHKSSQKNFSLFEATIQYLLLRKKQISRPLILTAKELEEKLALYDSAIPTTIITDPPQILLPVIYSSCSIWLAPSLNEGFGLTPLEAMACGCPVVMYPNDGLAGIAKHNVNCLFAKNKYEAVDGIQKLLASAPLREKIVREGLHTSKQFSWQLSAKRFKSALTTILKEG